MNSNFYDSDKNKEISAEERKRMITKEMQRKKEDLHIHVSENETFENLRNLVGPSFIVCK